MRRQEGIHLDRTGTSTPDPGTVGTSTSDPGIVGGRATQKARTGMTGDLMEAVRAAQTGDEDAFRLVYRSVQPGLLRYLTALVGADAEDVASETWLQIARDLQSFDGGAGFRAWAATIARNRALDHLRHRHRRPGHPVPVEELTELPGSDDTAERADERVSTDRAIALIATLPRKEAEAVLLRSVVGLDAESAGQVLGRRAGAVRTAAHRGLRRLAQLLEHAGEPATPRTFTNPFTRSTPAPPTAGPLPAHPSSGPANRHGER